MDGLSCEDLDFLTLYHQCCLVTKWESERGEGTKKGWTNQKARRHRGLITSGG
jgi:hypothetical protein